LQASCFISAAPAFAAQCNGKDGFNGFRAAGEEYHQARAHQAATTLAFITKQFLPLSAAAGSGITTSPAGA
jgi:hypothetical protein